MQRDEMLERLVSRSTPWDIAVIGGGATGVGVALDAAARGYQVVLLEQSDFGKGTSSRSTKIVHGGVRYLRQGRLGLVREALRERDRLQRNASHLVHPLPFLIPGYRWGENTYYGAGLKLYDWLAGRSNFGRSRRLTVAEVQQRVPNLRQVGLRGGTVYYDGQFDDARLLINLVQTAAEQGATVLNYCRVARFRKGTDGRITGLVAVDEETNAEVSLDARVVVSAAGPYTDAVRKLDEPQAERLVVPSQGIHLVVDATFLGGETALLVPRTSDGRVVFLIPWQGCTLIGTTDTPISEPLLEPRPLPSEIDFLLETSGRYLDRAPSRQDVRSAFAGLRPLIRSGHGKRTSQIARNHRVVTAPSGLITIAGGKWTTYRQMAADCVDRAAAAAGLKRRKCVTRSLPLHGHQSGGDLQAPFAGYGSDAELVAAAGPLVTPDSRPLPADLPCHANEVLWAVRQEMARTVEDVLARRTRALLLDARAACEAAPQIAKLMSRELRRDSRWQAEQVAAFRAMAACYLVSEA